MRFLKFLNQKNLSGKNFSKIKMKPRLRQSKKASRNQSIKININPTKKLLQKSQSEACLSKKSFRKKALF